MRSKWEGSGIDQSCRLGDPISISPPLFSSYLKVLLPIQVTDGETEDLVSDSLVPRPVFFNPDRRLRVTQSDLGFGSSRGRLELGKLGRGGDWPALQSHFCLKPGRSECSWVAVHLGAQVAFPILCTRTEQPTPHLTSLMQWPF